jgi:hemoglobin-like flavoprotein
MPGGSRLSGERCSMTREQKELLRSSFATVARDPDKAAALFYQRLFELDPSLRPLFLGSIKEQGRKLMQMLQTALDSLDRLENLVPTLWQLGKRHGGYGVKDHHYDTVGQALIWTLEQALGYAFTTATREAWTEVYTLMATTMKRAAAEGVIARQ